VVSGNLDPAECRRGGGIYYEGVSYGGPVPGTGTPPKLDIIRPDTAWSIAIHRTGYLLQVLSSDKSPVLNFSTCTQKSNEGTIVHDCTKLSRILISRISELSVTAII
jgi:hypothetical protein